MGHAANLFRSEADMVVIGAGAAGIAAARRLAVAKASFVVLEARSRLGGRAWTLSHSLEHPLDLGCGWLHSAEHNPWTAIAESAGFTIDRTLAPWTSRAVNPSFNGSEQADFYAASERFYARLEAAGGEGIDRTVAEFLEPGCRWNPLLNAVSTYANGVELSRLSMRDYGNYADSGVNWRVKEGLGSAIAAYGSGLPVQFDCPVTRIDHSGSRLRIETACGDIAAKAAIITVPTAMIASEAIRFTPALPDKLAAASVLPLGLADKLVLLLDEAELAPKETRLFGNIAKTATGSYHLQPFGRPLIEGYFGGELARELEQAGAGAFADFAIGELASQLGSNIRARLHPLAATAWAQDPYARGSYSYALPGHAGARAILAKPVNGRLFFAGEACSLDSFSTVHGAYLTGLAAAENTLAAIGLD